jgi:hypothetical protein
MTVEKAPLATTAGADAELKVCPIGQKYEPKSYFLPIYKISHITGCAPAWQRGSKFMYFFDFLYLTLQCRGLDRHGTIVPGKEKSLPNGISMKQRR